MIDFDGMDIVIQTPRDDDQVRRALSTALLMPPERVAVINDVGDYPETGAADVVCVTSPVDGEFTRLLSVQVSHQALPYDSREQLMQRICDVLDTRCLVPTTPLIRIPCGCCRLE